MNFFGVTFLAVGLIAQFTLPRRLAALPLVLAFAWTTRGLVVELGSVNISVMRILIAAAVIRAWSRGEHLLNGPSRADKWIYAWVLVLLVTTPWHLPDTTVYRLGLVWDYVGIYFVFRLFVTSREDVVRIFKFFFFALLPVGLSMLYEQQTNENIFRALGGVPLVSPYRNNSIRAMGPFPHPILAGTAGATLIPMAAYLWTRARGWSIVGGLVGFGIVYSTGSSGPIMMAAIGLAAMLAWPLRQHLRFLRWMGVLGLLFLHMVMNDPVYFLLAKIDLAGGSTGWHRAQLIQSFLAAVSEWWLYGTDYTRHWMPTGIPANDRHTDITNHFIAMAIYGGLCLLFVFCALLVSAFRMLGQAMKDKSCNDDEKFLAWSLGAILAAHCFNFFAIVLFDQSVFCFLAIVGLTAAFQTKPEPVSQSEFGFQASARKVGVK